MAAPYPNKFEQKAKTRRKNIFFSLLIVYYTFNVSGTFPVTFT
ncbi:hypothetical protein RG47T_0964 [Mucilaginibacter polytrichastri]|uniref:Uncharacterized protein n=1 Tax=Mucilaginibacter polytrichastri TaxID=1302689 RepID=A0A1Q5ZV10_9SPHI|nr:hypothetical protein RG47T_0964 [Mucilaginibacter polytrichastri]